MKVVKLKPAIKDYIWAGNKLKGFGKVTDFDKIAECWELSFHKDGPCVIDSGDDEGKLLKDVATPKDIGNYVSTFPFFPVLIKLIDSGDNLSVQVHPSDEYALANEDSYGKTEMWYVLHRDEGCGLYVGLKEDSSKAEIEKSLNEGTILDKLNFYPVEEGECYFIKSGTIHAIGKGVTLIEIQQNSNLTYRLYDYNRIGKDGQPRELHIAKALEVIDYKKYTPIKFNGNMIGKSKYFASYVYDVSDKNHIQAPASSFVSITFISGEGKINGIPYKTYESFFIPASQAADIKGSGKYVLTTVERDEKKAIGIDIGGTSFKVGLVNTKGKIEKKYSFLVDHKLSQNQLIGKLAASINEFLEDNYLTKDDIIGIGIGCPGSIDTEKGVCDYSNNLQWDKLDVCGIISKVTGINCKISNDANVACLGEARFGSGKTYNSVVLITLGTGVGGGIVIDHKLFEGNKGKGAEIGHTVIKLNGKKCTCGRKGCLEAYASATALIRDTKTAMRKDKKSLMWEYVHNNIALVDGKTAFECSKKGDASACKVVDDYIYYLGEGILNFCNIFRPDAILLGGGVAYQKEYLIDKLVKYAEDHDYGFKMTPKVEIRCAELGNDAGIIGAACLVF